MASQNSWKSISSELKKIFEKRPKFTKNGYFDEQVKDVISRKGVFLDSCDKFGTPQYILDEAALLDRARLFMNTFSELIPNSEFLYPFKCNDLPYLVNVLKGVGFNADVAGLFELELALKEKFENIIFSSPGKELDELKLAIENRDRVVVSIDNLDELNTFLELVRKSSKKENIRISFRLNPLEDPSDMWSKFGLTLNELRKAVDKIKSNQNLSWVGLHFHSSWNKTPERYVKNIEKIGKNLKNNFKQQEIEGLCFLDIGGGFYPEGEGTLLSETPKGMLIELLKSEGIDHSINFDATDYYVDESSPLEEFSKKISAAVKDHIVDLLNKKHMKIFYEPGSFIAKNSTYVLTKVLAVKSPQSIIVDAGTLTMLGGYGLANYEYTPIVNLSRPSLEKRKATVYGPLCEPSDIWGYRYYGGKAQPGDKIAILNRGAYTFSFSQRFIKPGAAYIVITKHNKLVVAKKKECFEERYSGCQLDFQKP